MADYLTVEDLVDESQKVARLSAELAVAEHQLEFHTWDAANTRKELNEAEERLAAMLEAAIAQNPAYVKD